jgi:SpoVK/Ycf46/Vps4 family AAA+-type ATPase
VAEEDVADVAGKFVLTPGRIRAAGLRAVQLAAERGDRETVVRSDLHAGARSQSGQGLRRLAQRVEPVYGWDDIVLPRRAMRQLEEVYASVEHRGRVYSEWGFERKLALGKGTNVLFAGPSGTGKTMAASILARELHLDLYKIDLATVVSKYIGETEKNLARIFREAQASNAILFFDEADALFGRRSEVKDSHDRYANIEVAYLLQRMEEYEGISILATNLRKSLDQAFARRLQHTVEFPFPDADYRERIWRRIFPTAAPLAGDVDFAFLAKRFEFAGGSIKNVALAAAFLAAEDGGRISMAHLIRATARELRKIGKLPTKSEFREYYELIREAA